MRKCEWCQDPFEPKRKDSRFCQKTHETACKYCGKTIPIKNMKRIPVYCSVSCSSRSRQYTSICVLCGNEYVSGKRDSKFCRSQHHANCVICAKQFELNVYQPALTCSPACASHLINFEERNSKTAHTLSVKNGVNVTNASQLESVKEKKRIQAQRRYHVDNVSQAAEVQEKRKNTNYSRYGVTNGGGAEPVQARIRETNQLRYGVNNVFQVEEIKKRIQNTLQLRYGVDNAFQLPQAQENLIGSGGRRISKINIAWAAKIEAQTGQQCNFEAKFSPHCYADLGVGDVFIDINPTITHNVSTSYVHAIKRCSEVYCKDPHHAPPDKNMHYNRFLAAEKAGNVLLQYFDWYDEEIFLSVIASKLRMNSHAVGARKCQLHRISQREANVFLKKNHLLGAATGQKFCVGVYFKEELVHVQTYGPARLNKKYEWEAIRSASKIDWHVQGAFSRCDNMFFREATPKSMVSYVDLSMSTGATELMFSGWKTLATNRPNSTWVFSGSDKKRGVKPKFVRDLTAQKISADRLLGMEIGAQYPSHHEDGRIFTNHDVLIAEGYLQVFDAGTRTFAWHKS